MTPLEAAWVAGFLEGEGCFTLIRNKICVTAASTDHDVLVGLHGVCGGTLAGPRRVKNSTKDFWIWYLGSRPVLREFLPQIRPFMGERRGARIDAMLRAMDELDAAREARLKPCGTRSKYERGCRCDACRQAKYAYRASLKMKGAA